MASVSKYKFTLSTAIALVVANMIGTGVFSSLGFQLLGTPSVFAIMLLWMLGAFASLLGSFSYVTLASILPRSGGEYHFMSAIYGPATGFVAGFITLVVGFAAPIAVAAMAFSNYSQQALFNSTSSNWIVQNLWAIIPIILITIVHLIDTKKGARFQDAFTWLKLILIFAFLAAGFWLIESPQPISVIPNSLAWEAIKSPAFAVSFIYVTFSYTGWNAPVYLLDEIENPQKTIPLAIIGGMLIVAFLYISLNYVFLLAAPISALQGKVEVAHEAAKYVIGNSGARFMSSLIAFGLISSISSMIITSSRVAFRIGNDYKKLSFLASETDKKVPHLALISMAVLSCIFVISGSFETVLTYAGIVLNAFGAISVFGLFILKAKGNIPAEKWPYGKWFFPLVPFTFVALNLGIIVYFSMEKPLTALTAFLTYLFAYFIYLLLGEKQK